MTNKKLETNTNHDNITEPAQFLVDHIDLLRKGRTLDIAMGVGRNAVYLARNGFTVEGVDISSDSIQQALSLAQVSGVTIRAQVADLEKDYQIEPEAYDLIICFNYLQRSLIPQIKAGLRSGGFVVYETFIVDQPQFGHPRNPDFLLRYNELLDMFRDLRCLRYREGIFDNNKAIASILATKV